MTVKFIKKLPKFKEISDHVTKEQHKLFQVDSVHDVEKPLAIFLIDGGFAELTDEQPAEDEQEKDTRAKGFYVLSPISLRNQKLEIGHKLIDAEVEVAKPFLKMMLEKKLLEEKK